MLKPWNWLAVSLFLTTIEVYRIRIGSISMPFSLIPLFIAGMLILPYAAISGRSLRISKNAGLVVAAGGLFEVYRLFSLFRNYPAVPREIVMNLVADLVGYSSVVMAAASVHARQQSSRIVNGFALSSVFVVLGYAYYVYVFLTTGRLLGAVPFGAPSASSSSVLSYLESPANFMGFPIARFPFGSSASTGLYMSLESLLVLALILGGLRSRKSSVIGLGGLVVSLLTLVGTFSRTGWAVFAVGSCSVLVTAVALRLLAPSRMVKVTLVGMSVLLVLMVVPTGKDFMNRVLIRTTLEGSYQSNAGHLRHALWALQVWSGHPVLGAGEGGYWLKFGEWYPESTLFAILADDGLVGLGLLLLLFSSMRMVLRRSLSLSVSGGHAEDAWVGLGLLGGLYGLVVGSILYQVISQVFWAYLALVVAYVNSCSYARVGDAVSVPTGMAIRVEMRN